LIRLSGWAFAVSSAWLCVAVGFAETGWTGFSALQTGASVTLITAIAKTQNFQFVQTRFCLIIIFRILSLHPKIALESLNFAQAWREPKPIQRWE
jgi:hypothetical protein